MMKRQTRMRIALAGSAVVLAAGLSGCSVISNILGGSQDAPRDDQSGAVTQSSNIDIFSLKVGDCKMADGSNSQVSDTDVVPCTDPHDEEVFYEFKMPDGTFDSTAVDTAAEQCYGQPFTDFVGVASDASTLEVYYLAPTQQTWDKLNDRLVQCIITDPAGKTTGSLKGAAR